MSKELIETCNKKLEERGLADDPRYKKRLRWELEEIVAKNKTDYFWNLFAKKIRYPKNQKNLLVCWLLGIVKDHDIDSDPVCKWGEFPDIDIDYLPVVQQYMKNVWAKKVFGEAHVCNISNYTTFGIKSAALDMARVHGESKDEIQEITKIMDDKDDEGKAITWDAALRLYPEFKKYCENHKDVADATKKLLHRIRGMGVHAGGLIISSTPLHDLVPLVKRKNKPQASAWPEGLHSKDLQPVGLIKFDLLVITNLLQIARCCHLVKQRHRLDGICNLPGLPDWSDIKKWRNDPDALEMANRGDLKGIFQFDKESVRRMARQGGVTRFEDLVAYTSLNRPGTLLHQLDKRYIERKRGREEYHIHPLMQPILDKTYGIACYQEQVMKILNVVGGIPQQDCELLRKAISVKKVDSFGNYKDIFIRNGAKNLGVSEKEAEELWLSLESWSEYGFNLSHAVAYTYLTQQLLYMKCHYPHEFYVSILACEPLSEKIKEYKMEAQLHGVKVNRVDINKSKVEFELLGDEIYFGISSIKGIGEAPAKKIVDGQPYHGFEDFLHRFGTDKTVLKRLIGLGCFTEADPVTLWKFTESYKKYTSKLTVKQKTFIKSMARYDQEFSKLLPDEKRTLADFVGDKPFSTEYWKNLYDKNEFIEVQKEVECGPEEGEPRVTVVYENIGETDEVQLEKEIVKYYKMGLVTKKWNRWKALKRLWLKRQQTIKMKDPHLEVPRLATFDPSEEEIENELLVDLRNPVNCENKFYGFPWVHDLEKSPDYKGNRTFDVIKNDPECGVGVVELMVEKTMKMQSKKGNSYYQVTATDVTGEVGKINVWEDDWKRWEKEFTKGNLLRVRLQPPSGGFYTFLLESNSVPKWRSKLRYKDKGEDPRVFVMRFPPKEEEKYYTDEEALSHFSDCTMEE